MKAFGKSVAFAAMCTMPMLVHAQSGSDGTISERDEPVRQSPPATDPAIGSGQEAGTDRSPPATTGSGISDRSTARDAPGQPSSAAPGEQISPQEPAGQSPRQPSAPGGAGQGAQPGQATPPGASPDRATPGQPQLPGQAAPQQTPGESTTDGIGSPGQQGGPQGLRSGQDPFSPESRQRMPSERQPAAGGARPGTAPAGTATGQPGAGQPGAGQPLPGQGPGVPGEDTGQGGEVLQDQPGSPAVPQF